MSQCCKAQGGWICLEAQHIRSGHIRCCHAASPGYVEWSKCDRATSPAFAILPHGCPPLQCPKHHSTQGLWGGHWASCWTPWMSSQGGRWFPPHASARVESLANLDCMSQLWIGQVSQTFLQRPWNPSRAGSCGKGYQQNWLGRPPCAITKHNILALLANANKRNFISQNTHRPLACNLFAFSILMEFFYKNHKIVMSNPPTSQIC